MGRRGPAPEPAAKKLARGETRPSRVNFLEPAPKPGPLDPPRDMDHRAKEVWAHVIATQQTGVIYPIDRDLLRAYSEAVSRYEEAAKLYASSVPLVEGRAGGMVKNGLHQIVRDNLADVKALARELAIGPAARAGLAVEPGPAAVAEAAGLEDLGPPPRLRMVAGGLPVEAAPDA